MVAEMCLHQDSVPLLTYDVRKAGHTPPISELFLEAIEMLLEGEPARDPIILPGSVGLLTSMRRPPMMTPTVKEWPIKYPLAAYLLACVSHP